MFKLKRFKPGMFKPMTSKQTPTRFGSPSAVEGHGSKPCRSHPPNMRLSAAAVRCFSASTLYKIALLVFALVCFRPRLQAQSADLPPGPVQAKVRTACLECHDANIIVQQRLSKPAWTKEVDKMIKWGALVDAADRDAFIDYLSTNFPPDKPPAEMPKSAKK
jgi:hypothetical protein